DEAGTEGFGDRRHDHGDCRCGILDRQRRRRSSGHNQIDVRTNQLARHRRKALGATIGRAIFDGEILPLDIPKAAQTVSKGGEVGAFQVSEFTPKHTTPIDLGRLRPRGRKRQTRRTAEKRDERAPVHSITSSARPSKSSGMVSPSALAVLRLMMSVYLSARWMGNSPGFAPLRMRST